MKKIFVASFLSLLTVSTVHAADGTGFYVSGNNEFYS